MSTKKTAPAQPTPLPVENPFAPDAILVKLGPKQYPIVEVPIGRIRLFQAAWTEMFTALQDMSPLDMEEEGAFDNVFSMITDGGFDLLASVIPALQGDKDLFLDPDTGATIPQVLAAGEQVLKVNKCEWLKAMLPFAKAVLRMGAMRSGARKTNAAIEDMRKAQAEFAKSQEEAAAATP